MKKLRLLSIYVLSLASILAKAQNVGIGETAPGSKLAVKGSLSVGSGYSTTAAPANGAIFQGNVGIGTSTAGSPLTVAGKTTTTNFQMTGGAALGYVMVSDASGNGTWTSAAAVLAAFGTGSQNFVTKWNNAAGTTIGNSLIYDNGVNVGINTAAPTARLHIYTNTIADGVLLDGASNSIGYSLANSGTTKGTLGLAGSSGAWSSDASTNDIILRTQATSQKILFNTNGGAGTATMAINAGNVGIGGITAPNGVLAVSGKAVFGDNSLTSNDANDNIYVEKNAQYSQIHLYNNYSSGGINAYISENASGSNSGFGNTNAGLNIWTASAHPIRIATNATERLTVLSGGNVGIGNANPGSGFTPSSGPAFDVYGKILQYAGFNGDPTINMTGAGWNRIVASTSGSTLAFFTSGNGVNNNTPQMTIGSSGVVAVANLAGSGNRFVYADASGNLNVLSATPSANGNKFIYDYTGSNQYFTVPAGVISITVQLWGAGGAGGYNSSSGSGGGGGYVSGTLNVTPGEVLTFIIGGAGCQSCTNNAFGGGGAGSPNCQGGSGGGRTAIRRGSTELCTAGGGGGGSRESTNSYGGAGGGSTGGTNGLGGGGGGTQTAGGAAGNVSCGGAAGAAGSAFQGGNAGGGTGCGSGYAYGGGGGGGGYYGGGGGAQVNSSGCNYGSAGGGGSSYTGGFASVIANTQGTSGNGNGTTYYAGNNAGLPSGYVNVRGQGGGYGSSGGNGLLTVTW